MSSPARAGGRSKRIAVTGLFDTAEAVQGALEELVAAGLPRDLIEVVASPEAVERFYHGRALRSARDTFRWAGVGAIVGLLVGAAVSLALVALPGFRPPGLMAWVQLVGPNLATVTGAVLGAVYGWFRRRRPSPWHARLRDGDGRILVAAFAHGEPEVEVVVRILGDAGGAEVRTEGR